MANDASNAPCSPTPYTSNAYADVYDVVRFSIHPVFSWPHFVQASDDLYNMKHDWRETAIEILCIRSLSPEFLVERHTAGLNPLVETTFARFHALPLKITAESKSSLSSSGAHPCLCRNSIRVDNPPACFLCPDHAPPFSYLFLCKRPKGDDMTCNPGLIANCLNTPSPMSTTATWLPEAFQ